MGPDGANDLSVEDFSGWRRFLYNFSTTGWVLIDSVFMTFYVAFLLPPKEKVAQGMIRFISDKTFFGVFTVLGTIMIFGRIVDAIADPLVASWSDRAKVSIGRRKLFLILGGFPLALFSILVFFPPVNGISWVNGIYLALIFGGYFFAFTLYVSPYLALIPELGHTDSERLGMTTSQGYFSLLGNAIVMIGGPILLGYFMKSGSPVSAYRKMALLLVLPGLVIAYLAVFAVDEKRFSSAKPSEVPLKESFLMTIRNKSFVIYLLSNLALWFVLNIVRSSAIPIALTLVKADEAFASNFFTVLFVTAAILFPLVWFLGKKIGKKVVMISGLLGFFVVSILFAMTGIIPINPKLWVLLVAAVGGYPVAVLLIIPNVILAEICERDSAKTGERREAMFFGVQGFFMKLNLGVSTALLALLYSSFGKDVSNPLGIRLSLVLGGLVSLLGFFVMFLYREEKDYR